MSTACLFFRDAPDLLAGFFSLLKKPKTFDRYARSRHLTSHQQHKLSCEEMACCEDYRYLCWDGFNSSTTNVSTTPASIGLMTANYKAPASREIKD